MTNDLLPEHEMIDLRIELDSISPEYADAHCFPAMRYFAKKYFDEHSTPNKSAEVDLDSVIKPFEWTQRKQGVKFCNTAVGFYEIGDDGFVFSPYICKYPDYQTAIAAITEDYNGKVRSLLTSSGHLATGKGGDLVYVVLADGMAHIFSTEELAYSYASKTDGAVIYDYLVDNPERATEKTQ